MKKADAISLKNKLWKMARKILFPPMTCPAARANWIRASWLNFIRPAKFHRQLTVPATLPFQAMIRAEWRFLFIPTARRMAVTSRSATARRDRIDVQQQPENLAAPAAAG